MVDTEDLILEKINPNNPNQYEYLGEWKDMEVEKETFQIKNAAPVVKELKWTRNGPLVHEPLGLGNPIAVRSMILKVNASQALSMERLGAARDTKSFSVALQLISIPLNGVAADIEGNILYHVTGSAPIRSQGYGGDIPVPGWDGKHEWIGFVPQGEMPHGLNPEEGFYATANNKIIGDDFPYYLGRGFANGYRAARIHEILKQKINAKSAIAIEELRAMQIDTKSLAALDFIKICKKYDAEVRKMFFGKGAHPVLAGHSEFGGYDLVSLMRMLNNASSVWVKKAGGPVHLFKEGMIKSVRWFERELGPNMQDWQWGKVHQFTVTHVLGAVPPLDKIFNTGPFPVGGDSDTLLHTPSQGYAPYDLEGWSSHFRICFDMGDLQSTRSIHIPGQSGNLGSAHYDDMIPEWRNGGTHPLLLTEDQISQNLERTLTLIKKQ